MFGPIADGYTLNMHPMVFAAWFGMLATALNLLPFGQLDGGHITYATLGRWSTPISIATVATAVVMTFVSHQLAGHDGDDGRDAVRCSGRAIRACIDEYEPLGRGRHVVAVFALVMFDPLLHAGPDSLPDPSDRAYDPPIANREPTLTTHSSDRRRRSSGA